MMRLILTDHGAILTTPARLSDQVVATIRRAFDDARGSGLPICITECEVVDGRTGALRDALEALMRAARTDSGTCRHCDATPDVVHAPACPVVAGVEALAAAAPVLHVPTGGTP